VACRAAQEHPFDTRQTIGGRLAQRVLGVGGLEDRCVVVACLGEVAGGLGGGGEIEPSIQIAWIGGKGLFESHYGIGVSVFLNGPQTRAGVRIRCWLKGNLRRDLQRSDHVEELPDAVGRQAPQDSPDGRDALRIV
jgi:hypothetical protein